MSFPIKNLVCLKNYYLVIKIILVLLLRLTWLYFKNI